MCAEALHMLRPVAILHFATARKNEQMINENRLMTIPLDIATCRAICVAEFQTDVIA